jgi:hypothetical protein
MEFRPARASLPILLATIAACAVEGGAPGGIASNAGGHGSTGGGSWGTDGSSGVGGSGTGASSPDVGGRAGVDAGGDSGSGEDAGPCAASAYEAKPAPLDIHIMLDRSCSMEGDKWDAARSGLKQFVSDPAAHGLNVALTYFPQQGGLCKGGEYAQADVAMAPLPGNSATISSSLDQTQLNYSDGTPTEGALMGISGYCKAQAANYPDHTVVGILVTDGKPNGCNENDGDLAAIAGEAFSTAPSVRVYAMGMEGADFDLLDDIAAAGGTGTPLNVTTGGAQSFLAALKKISAQALPCQYMMPEPAVGQVDPNQVNVTFTRSDGTEQPLGGVVDESACVANAWYYDNPSNPTMIVLCPETCELVKADLDGKMEILLGCKTIDPPERTPS